MEPVGTTISADLCGRGSTEEMDTPVALLVEMEEADDVVVAWVLKPDLVCDTAQETAVDAVEEDAPEEDAN